MTSLTVPKPVGKRGWNVCIALFSCYSQALKAVKCLASEGFSCKAVAIIGTISPWLVPYLSQPEPVPDFPQTLVVHIPGDEAMAVIGFPIFSVSRRMNEGNRLNKQQIFSLALAGMKIPVTNQHEYTSALNHGQMLVIVRGSTSKVERAADLLATGEEVEVAVYQGISLSLEEPLMISYDRLQENVLSR